MRREEGAPGRHRHAGLDEQAPFRRANTMPPLGWRKSAASTSAAVQAKAVMRRPAEKKENPQTSETGARKRGRPVGSKNVSKAKDASNPSQNTSKLPRRRDESDAGESEERTVDGAEVFLKQIKDLEKRADIAGLVHLLCQYPQESEVQLKACKSLLKLITVNDQALADRYITIALGGNPDAGDDFSGNACMPWKDFQSAGRGLKERLMLNIYEHGEDDKELQDVVFGLLCILSLGLHRSDFYKFFWEKHDNPDAYHVLSQKAYGSEERLRKLGIELRAGDQKASLSRTRKWQGVWQAKQ